LKASTELIETAPWGRTAQPAFLNAVARVETTLSADALLDVLKAAERRLGRAPSGLRWGPRIIDLDILIFGDAVVESPHLTIPHPRLIERDFVLRQVLDLAPDIRHPALKRPLSAFLR